MALSPDEDMTSVSEVVVVILLSSVEVARVVREVTPKRRKNDE